MSASFSTVYSTSPVPDGYDDDFGNDDDDFLVEDGDDGDDFELDEMNDNQAPPSRYNLHPRVAMCIVCHQRPAFSRGSKSYPTCGMNCGRILESGQILPPSSGQGSQRGRGGRSGRGGHQAGHSYSYNAAPQNNAGSYYAQNDVARGYHNPNITDLAFQRWGGRAGGGPHYYQPAPGPPPFAQQRYFAQPQQQHRPRPPPAPRRKCIVCLVKPCHGRKYVTCGLTCAEKLSKGGVNPTMCDYCHRRPKLAGHEQCGQACRDRAKVACLLCKSRPKFGRYHLCGKSCKKLATKSTPLILEAPPGHATFELVEKKFQSSWKGASCPPIKKIYKIIENKSFLTPYDKYKRQVRNESFRYHGTRRTCTLGSPGNTQLCSQTTCALCSILKTSFKVSLANPAGFYGAGVYSSSASSMSHAYAGGTGAIMLCKVVLGKIRGVNAPFEVRGCPPGFNSVEFDANGPANETIVYSDDAIRPVFLIVFEDSCFAYL